MIALPCGEERSDNPVLDADLDVTGTDLKPRHQTERGIRAAPRIIRVPGRRVGPTRELFGLSSYEASTAESLD
jgi:hypothetical protein